MDVRLLQQRLAVENPKVTAKAAELLRLAAVKVPLGTLRQGEVARPAICFELACSALSCPVDRKAVVRLSGATEKVYAQAIVLMQKLLGVKPRLTGKELCIQFGCVRIEGATMRALALYKERFLARLAPAARQAADFSRPAFMAAAFYLAARKAKLKVDRGALLQRHSIAPAEFTNIVQSMMDLCFDGVETKKRQLKTTAEDGLRGPAGDAGASDADEGSDSDGAVHRQPPAKRAKQKGYEEWKQKALKSRPKALSLEKLKQATLSFSSNAAE